MHESQEPAGKIVKQVTFESFVPGFVSSRVQHDNRFWQDVKCKENWMCTAAYM